MKIAVNGKSLTMPRMCCCCGGPSETYVVVSDIQRRGRMRYTSSWELPHCNQCASHVRFATMKWYDILLTLFTFGGWLPWFFIAMRPLKRAYARKHLMKPTCSDCDLTGYQYFLSGDGKHIFDLKHADFQKAFVALNRASIEGGNPEIRVLMVGS